MLDTNVLVSAILFGGVPRDLLRQALRGEFDMVSSPALLTELAEILEEKFGLSNEAARAIRSELELVADIVSPSAVPRVARDRDDDQVLAAAHAGRAAVIVSGDRDLLDLGEHDGVRIVAPADWAI